MALNLKNVRKTLLADHNRARVAHGADPLTVNSDLEAEAQRMAERLATLNRLDHSNSSYKGNPVGENVFCAYHSTKTPDDIATGATAKWYSEVDNFDFTRPEEVLGHFTQVVWKASKEVGFGIARSGDGHVYVVGQYFPAGNFAGHVSENVKPPKTGKRVDFNVPQLATSSPPSLASAGSSSGNKTKIGTKQSNRSEPIGKETKTEVKEEVVNGHRVRKTIATEIERFSDGTKRTLTHTQTETLS